MLNRRRLAVLPALVVLAACGAGQPAGPAPVQAPMSPVTVRCRDVQAQVQKAEAKGRHSRIELTEVTAEPPVPRTDEAVAGLLRQGAPGGRTWVLARGGAGKSHLAAWLQAQVCEQVPTLRLDAMRELRPRLAAAGQARTGLARALLQQMGVGAGGDPEVALREQLGDARWLLLLDGTDELTSAEKHQLQRELDWLAHADLPQPHVVRFERPGAATPGKTAQSGRILTLPELTCAQVDAAWEQRFADAAARTAATAWRDQKGLSARRPGAAACRYVHLATWRDVETVADLARDAQAGKDELGAPVTRAEIYAAWLGHRLMPEATTAAAALGWLDRIVAMGVISATEPDLLLTQARCSAVPPPGSTSAQQACIALVQSQAVRAGPTSGTWLLANQTLADLLLARWLAAKHTDCGLLTAATTSVASLEVTALVAAQPTGRRCLGQLVAATCSEGTPAAEAATFLEEVLPRDLDLAQLADRASTPCERAVFAALRPGP